MPPPRLFRYLHPRSCRFGSQLAIISATPLVFGGPRVPTESGTFVGPMFGAVGRRGVLDTVCISVYPWVNIFLFCSSKILDTWTSETTSVSLIGYWLWGLFLWVTYLFGFAWKRVCRNIHAHSGMPMRQKSVPVWLGHIFVARSVWPPV